ncbi:hypothetical protein BGW42_002963 [Actinomortierella wolfii]|nr:hypothetical protein BGW42_002963 [Actinomortierella wolfii]
MANTKVILENVFGMLGIVFWSFQLVPQAWETYKTKNVEGLSATMFLIWSLASIGFGSYGLVEELSIPLIVQPQIFGALSTACLLQCLYYTKNPRWKWSLKTTLIGGALMFVGMAALEAGAYFATKAGLDHQVKGTIEAAGILPVVLLGIGFFPQYFDIYRDRYVVSVSMPFIFADATGAIFSILSLVFREEFDLLATLNYVMVLICDLIIVVFWVYFNKMHPELARVPIPSQKQQQQQPESTVSSSSPATLADDDDTTTESVKSMSDKKSVVIDIDNVSKVEPCKEV